VFAAAFGQGEVSDKRGGIGPGGENSSEVATETVGGKKESVESDPASAQEEKKNQ